MKKIFTLAALAVFAVAANAQTETVELTEVSMEAQTEVASPNGLFKYMTSEATSAKGGTGTSVTYNGVTYAGGYSQGSTNVMSWAIQPTVDGSVDVAVKMGANKKTYVIEVDAAGYYDEAGEDLTLAGAYALAGGTGLCSDFQGQIDGGTATYMTNPTISGVGVMGDGTVREGDPRALSGSWNGTAAIWPEQIEDPVATAEKGKTTYYDEWEVISIPAKAGNVYVVGCAGSKLMARAITVVQGASAVAGIAEAKAEAAAPVKVIGANGIQIGKYNIAGQQVK